MSVLPISVIREAIAYDERAGTLIWKVRPRSHFLTDKAMRCFNARFPGVPALACVGHQGYPHGALNYLGKRYPLPAHRVAFAITHGRWPDPCVDHINGDRADFRLANLREATMRQNSYNSGPQPRNRLGIKGVYRQGKRFAAHGYLDGRRVSLGAFDTLEEAVDVRRGFASKHYGVFCRH